MARDNSTPLALVALPNTREPIDVARWFGELTQVDIPEPVGSADSYLAAAYAFVRRAKTPNTRTAYRAAVRAFTSWCAEHNRDCLPASPETVAAFLAKERLEDRKSMNTIALRCAAIRYYHTLAGFAPSPTDHPLVAQTIAGQRRDAARRGDRPRKKRGLTTDLLAKTLEQVSTAKLQGLRDRALLLIGLAGALRRSELAAIHVRDLEFVPKGLAVTLPVSKTDQTGMGHLVAIVPGDKLCPIKALKAWLDAAGIDDGPVFRRIWRAPPPGGPRARTFANPKFIVGTDAFDGSAIARIIKRYIGAADLPKAAFSGHSLRRGPLTSGMNAGVHPSHLQSLSRHRSLSSLTEYLEIQDAFDSQPLKGLM